MKKLISFLLVSVMCLSLCACGGNTSTNSNSDEENNSSANKEESKGAELVLATENNVADYADFTLFKVSTAKKITASVAGDIYFENKNAGETYIDIILDWTNTSSETISSNDILVATATNANGTEYTNCLYAVETNNATYLSQYENIAPLSTVRLHCAISVPESETELTLKIVVNGKEYTYGYALGEVASSAKEIKVGDTVEEADFATLVFNGIEYTDDLLPSNTSGSYRHYEVDNASNTYLVVKFDITNYMRGDKDCDTFVGVNAVYMDKYTYTGFVVVEDEDGKGFGSYESIAPLSTRHFYYLIEVPKTVVENEVKLTISFNGDEYIFTGK